jgi:hypothetical protein
MTRGNLITRRWKLCVNALSGAWVKAPKREMVGKLIKDKSDVVLSAALMGGFGSAWHDLSEAVASGGG